MKRILARYIAAQFIPPFLLSTCFFVSFLLTFQLFKIMQLVLNKGVALSTVISLIGYTSLSFLPIAIPLAILFSTLYSLNKLSHDSEIIAIRSFGFSKKRLLFPLLILGAAISLTVFTVNQTLAPYAKKELRKGMTILAASGVLADIQPGQFFNDIPGLTLFAEKVTDKKRLLEVFLTYKKPELKEEQVIFSEEGFIFKDKIDEWGRTALKLHLINGSIIKIEEENLDKILFKEYDLPLFYEKIEAEFTTKDSMRNGLELYHYIQQGKKLKKKMTKSRIEFWTRFNTAFSCITFIVLGFGLGIKSKRGKSSKTGLICFFILTVYYALYFSLVSLAKEGLFNPAAAVLAPSFIVMGFGAYFYHRLNWTA